MRAPCLALLLSCLVAAAEPPLQEGGPGLREALENRRVSLDVKDAEARAVFDALAKQAGLRWRLGGESANALDDRVVPALWLRKVPASDAIALLCRMLHLEYRVDEKGLLLGLEDDGELHGRAQPRIYAVGALVALPPSAAPELPSLAPPAPRRGEGPPTISEDRVGADEVVSAEALVELLQAEVDPESWEREGRSISVLGGDRLLVVTTPELHARVAARLRALGRERLQPIVLRAWWVDPALARRPAPLARWLASDAKRGPELRASGVSNQVLSLAAGARKPLAEDDGVRMLQTGSVLYLQPQLGSDRDGGLTVRVTVQAQHSELLDSGRLELTRARFTTRLVPGKVTPVMSAGGRALMLCAEVSQAGGASGRLSPLQRRNAEVRQVLARQKVSMDHRNTPLRGVVRELAKETGVDIVIDPDLLSERTPEELLVQLRVKGVAVADALKLILSLKQLGSIVDHGVCFITSLDEVREVVERRYRVDDLVHPAVSFGAPLADEDEEVEPLSLDGLISTLLDNVAPDSWDGDNVIRSAALGHGVLHVGNSEGVQLRVAAMLDALRTSRPTLTTRVQLVRDRSGALSAPRADLDLAQLPLGERLQKLLAAGGARLDGQAQLDAQSGQRVTLFSGAQHRRGRALDRHGLALTLTPQLLGDRVRLGLQVDASSRLRQHGTHVLSLGVPTLVASGGGYAVVVTVTRAP